MDFQIGDILNLLVAMGLGGLIGLEREWRDKSAGFRTLMFISAGSALFTIFSIRISHAYGLNGPGDPSRIAAQIVSGIGFLGAGVILREHGEVRGLTTAATIWMVAGLGVGAGAGFHLFSFAAALVILAALLGFPWLENRLSVFSRTIHYEIVCKAGPEKFEQIQEALLDHHLRIFNSKLGRRADLMTYKFQASGRPANHHAFVQEILHDPDVVEFAD